jgi:Uma2 family endonuclease
VVAPPGTDYPAYDGLNTSGWSSAGNDMAIEEKPLTLEEFLRLPEDKPALEFIDGRVRQKVSPQGWHSRLQVALVEHVNRIAFPERRAFAFPELRVTFAGSSRVPDVSVFRWNRIPKDATGRILNVFLEPPDIVFEIVSPEQSVNALIERCLWFVANGVHMALLVDPDDESVIAFRPEERITVRRGADHIDLGELLPDLDLTVDALFASLRMP